MDERLYHRDADEIVRYVLHISPPCANWFEADACRYPGELRATMFALRGELLARLQTVEPLQIGEQLGS